MFLSPTFASAARQARSCCLAASGEREGAGRRYTDPENVLGLEDGLIQPLLEAYLAQPCAVGGHERAHAESGTEVACTRDFAAWQPRLPPLSLQIVPINLSSRKSAKLIKGAVEIYHPGLPHGLTATHADLVNRDLLAFCKQGKRQVA